jgi:hypothetical protein
MAIAFDSASAQATGSNATSHTFAFTNTAGTFLLVGVVYSSASNPTSLTYNGVAMIAVDSIATSSNIRVYVYRLDSPATGSNNLEVNHSGSTTCSVGFITLTGAGGSGLIDKNSVAAGTSNFSTTLSLNATDFFVGFAGYDEAAASIGVVTGTQRAEDGNASDHSVNVATNTGTGSTSITWSRAASAEAAFVGVQVTEPISVNAAASPVSATFSASTPTVVGSGNVTASAVSATLSVPTPTVSTPSPDWVNDTKNSSTWVNDTKN